MNNQNWKIYVPIGLFVLASIVAFNQYQKRTNLDDKLDCFKRCSEQAKLEGSDKDKTISCLSACNQ